MEKKLLSGACICLLAAGTSAQHPTMGGYNVYYGHLHNHSEVSDGTGTPATAYDYAKNTAHLDFFGLADHSGSISSTEWTDVMNQANASNQDGIFTSFYGFEWSSGGNYGHVAVVNTDDYCTTSSPTNTFAGLVTWLASRPNGIAFFNHPGREDDIGLEFSHFTTAPSDQVVGMELWNKSTAYSFYYYNDGYYTNDNNKGYYDEANSRGWKIGASGSGDDHNGTWGTAQPFRLAILADTLTRADLLAAMQARRFFSTLDKNLALSFKMGGAEMGSTLEGAPYDIQIQARDEDGESFTKVMLFKNGSEMKTWEINTPQVNIPLPISTFDGDYYYIKVT
ncbi:MAG: putative metal-dependent phosphoesterase TrpH, contains domain, partial [Bacteroidota bacterium]|nr:putative metal-dependent phosphoesterase TrpH, contains domain [Bacteroidota bacterium]